MAAEMNVEYSLRVSTYAVASSNLIQRLRSSAYLVGFLPYACSNEQKTDAPGSWPCIVVTSERDRQCKLVSAQLTESAQISTKSGKEAFAWCAYSSKFAVNHVPQVNRDTPCS